MSVARRRYRSLDGLRGLAAFVVLIHHSLLAVPSLANPYASIPTPRSNGDWWWVYTPLHDFWDGTVAVYLFFILSGFVLTIPARSGKIRWRAYYPQRIARLYIPTSAGVGFALALFWLVPRVSREGLSWWMNSHAFNITVHSVVRDAILVRGTDSLSSSLWSLRWEVLFSLLLPAYVIIGRPAARYWKLTLVVVLAVIALGSQYGWFEGAAMYLPMFAIGSILAFGQNEIHAVFSKGAGGIPFFWSGILLAAAVLVDSKWLLLAFDPESSAWKLSLTVAMQTLGASLLVISAMWCGQLCRLLERPNLRWLGSRSFSLYLVHEPIVVSVAMLLGIGWQRTVILITVPIALVAADLFFRLIERPSHQIARWIGLFAAHEPRTVQVDPAPEV